MRLLGNRLIGSKEIRGGIGSVSVAVQSQPLCQQEALDMALAELERLEALDRADVQDLEDPVPAQGPHDEEASAQAADAARADVDAEDVGSPQQEHAPDQLGIPYIRNPGIPEERFLLTAGAGELRFNVMGQFIRAHCPHHDNCTRQRTTREAALASASGQGRPLGALCAWLYTARNFRSKRQHMSAPVASLEERAAARARFLQSRGAVEFANEHERDRRPDEPEEPSTIR